MKKMTFGILLLHALIMPQVLLAQENDQQRVYTQKELRKDSLQISLFPLIKDTQAVHVQYQINNYLSLGAFVGHASLKFSEFQAGDAESNSLYYKDNSLHIGVLNYIEIQSSGFIGSINARFFPLPDYFPFYLSTAVFQGTDLRSFVRPVVSYDLLNANLETSTLIIEIESKSDFTPIAIFGMQWIFQNGVFLEAELGAPMTSSKEKYYVRNDPVLTTLDNNSELNLEELFITKLVLERTAGSSPEFNYGAIWIGYSLKL